jgi:hypothetical protein
MANNITLPTGEVVATIESGGVHTQVVNPDGNHAQPLCQFLSTGGDGTGTIDAIGDYSSGTTQFYIEPAAGQNFEIGLLIIEVEDGQGMAATDYGNIAALTNGIKLQKRTGASTIDYELTAGESVKTNADWAGFAYDADVKSWSSGDEVLVVRWTFTATGGHVELDGDLNERLVMLLADDMTGLVHHRFLAQGLLL